MIRKSAYFTIVTTERNAELSEGAFRHKVGIARRKASKTSDKAGDKKPKFKYTNQPMIIAEDGSAIAEKELEAIMDDTGK